MRRSECAVLLLVEAEDHLRPLDHDRPPDQVRVIQHQRDRLLLRLRQRPLLEHRATRADEIEEALRVDVLLEELTRGRFLVDVDLVDRDACRIQKTSGILAGRSGGFGIESRRRHPRRIIETADVDDQRDLPLCPGRVVARGTPVRIRQADRLRPPVLLVRHAILVP